MDEWNKYLAGLHDQKMAAIIGLFWVKAKHQLPNLPVPQAESNEDGVIFQLAWNNKEHHIDLDFAQYYPVEWFYCNRLTKEMDCNDGDLDCLSERFWDKLKLICGDK